MTTFDLEKELILADHQLSDSIFLESKTTKSEISTIPVPRFSQSCLGGTFDRLHAGHKILLSEACLVATDKTVIGLAHGDLLKEKLLRVWVENFKTS